MDISEDVIESDQDRDIIYYKMNNKWMLKNNFTENGINYSNYRSLLGQSILLDGKTVTIESIAPYAILQKAVTKEQLDSIQRIYIDYEPKTPLDCVVSVLQILGTIDNECALFIREITKNTGIGMVTLANLFSYSSRRKCDIVPAVNFNLFISMLEKSLKKGYLCVCGWVYEDFGHTFVVAMDEKTSKKYVIDLQTKGGIMDFNTYFSQLSQTILERIDDDILWVVGYDVETISE